MTQLLINQSLMRQHCKIIWIDLLSISYIVVAWTQIMFLVEHYNNHLLWPLLHKTRAKSTLIFIFLCFKRLLQLDSLHTAQFHFSQIYQIRFDIQILKKILVFWSTNPKLKKTSFMFTKKVTYMCIILVNALQLYWFNFAFHIS